MRTPRDVRFGSKADIEAANETDEFPSPHGFTRAEDRPLYPRKRTSELGLVRFGATAPAAWRCSPQSFVHHAACEHESKLASDHEQSLQWIFTGNIDEMICTLAYHSPGKRQTRVLEGV